MTDVILVVCALGFFNLLLSGIAESFQRHRERKFMEKDWRE